MSEDKRQFPKASTFRWHAQRYRAREKRRDKAEAMMPRLKADLARVREERDKLRALVEEIAPRWQLMTDKEIVDWGYRAIKMLEALQGQPARESNEPA